MAFEKSTYQWLRKSDFDVGLHPNGVLLELVEHLEAKKGDYGAEEVWLVRDVASGEEGAMSFWLKSRIFRKMAQKWGNSWPTEWIGKKFKARAVNHTNQAGKDVLIWEYDLDAVQ